MKIGYVNGVWFHLCLQAETVPFPIHMAILAFFIIHKIAGIELYTWTVRKHFHMDSCLFGAGRGNLTDPSHIIPVRYIVMIKSTRVPQLQEIGVNILS